METIYLILLIIPAALAFLVFYSIRQGRFKESESGFTQARVTVNYEQKTIDIRGRTYPVDKVTGIKVQAFSTDRHGESKSKNVVIEMDDLSKPIHKIGFLTGRQAAKFMQRICVALRKAEGPSFV